MSEHYRAVLNSRLNWPICANIDESLTHTVWECQLDKAVTLQWMLRALVVQRDVSSLSNGTRTGKRLFVVQQRKALQDVCPMLKWVGCWIHTSFYRLPAGFNVAFHYLTDLISDLYHIFTPTHKYSHDLGKWKELGQSVGQCGTLLSAL